MLDSNLERIQVREFLRTFTKLTNKQSQKEYLILRHGKPIGIYTPLDDSSATPLPSGKPGSGIDGLKKLRFKSGDAGLSDRIDEILYGSTND